MIVPKLHRLIDIARTGNALFDHAHRFQPQRHSQATWRKSGNITHDDRFFLHARRHVADNRSRFAACLFPHDDFDQPHNVYWIEEMHTDHILWSKWCPGDFGDRKGRSIGREDTIIIH